VLAGSVTPKVAAAIIVPRPGRPFRFTRQRQTKFPLRAALMLAAPTLGARQIAIRSMVPPNMGARLMGTLATATQKWAVQFTADLPIVLLFMTPPRLHPSAALDSSVDAISAAGPVRANP